MEGIKNVLDRVLYWITVVLFALLVVVVVWQIFSRQVLGAPSTWTEEAARMTFVWLGLFAAAFVFGERGHIAVEFVARKFTAGGQRALAIVVQAILLGFAVLILIWGGALVVMNAWTQNLSALPVTLGQLYLGLPVAGVLIAFYSVYHLRGQVRGLVLPYPEVSIEEVDAKMAGPVRGGDPAQESRLLHDDGSTEGRQGPRPAAGNDADEDGRSVKDEDGRPNTGQREA